MRTFVCGRVCLCLRYTDVDPHLHGNVSEKHSYLKKKRKKNTRKHDMDGFIVWLVIWSNDRVTDWLLVWLIDWWIDRFPSTRLTDLLDIAENIYFIYFRNDQVPKAILSFIFRKLNRVISLSSHSFTGSLGMHRPWTISRRKKGNKIRMWIGSLLIWHCAELFRFSSSWIRKPVWCSLPLIRLFKFSKKCIQMLFV